MDAEFGIDEESAWAAAGVPNLVELASVAGYSPQHFHRLFKRATGVTPAEYARAKRARNVARSLASNRRVIDAVYEAGYAAPGRFYAEA